MKSIMSEMKTKKAILTVLALVFVCSVFASELPKMNVVSLSNSKVYVTASTNSQFPSEVTLYNPGGNVVYYKKSDAAPEFRSVLNLSQLEDGMYTVCLKNGEVTTKRELEINKGCVCVKRLVKEMDPLFWRKGNKVYVTYLNCQKADVSVAIYRNNRLVQEEEMGSDFKLQRCFDLSQFAQGNFEFVLHGNSQNYNYRMSR